MTSKPETTTKDTALKGANLESVNESFAVATSSFNSSSPADGFLHFNGVLRS